MTRGLGIFSFINDLDNYEKRKIGRTDIGRLGISTVYTSDEGYETAILDADGTHPVERYPTKEAAILGHKKWCKKAKTLTKIIKLGGLVGLVGNKPYRLKIIHSKET